jgi:streptogramin lyase
MFKWVAAFAIVLGFFAGEASAADRTVRDIGVPVRSVNWVSLHAGRNREGTPCIYAAMGQTADNLFVLQIDPRSGAFRQFPAKIPDATYPTAALMSRTGRLYIGAAYAGHLLCFDPAKDALDDLGAIHAGAASFPCRMDEDQVGRIWIGSYPAADLTCYDPKTGRFTTYGRMDDVDMYNYPLVNADGTVDCLIKVTQPHIVVLDPKTGKKHTVGPVTTKGKETLDLMKGQDGRVYIVSSAGKFRIEGTAAVPVDSVPPSMPEKSLPDGTSFSFADASAQVYRKLTVRAPGGKVRDFNLNYKTSGSDIFLLHAGPDGCMYGSSTMPLHFFRYNPKDGTLVDLGQCSTSAGEAYSMANLRGRIYVSCYPGAHVSEYDPAAPYHFGTGAGDNPRELGSIDDISYRPRSTLAGPAGRVWVASLPDYGRWGGPLSYYDPATGAKKAFYRVFGDGSCYTLAHLEAEHLIAVGTSIEGGSGTQPKVGQAALLLWDYTAQRKVWQGTLDRPVYSFNALLTGPDGKLYGTVVGGGGPEIFVFDPKSRTFGRRIPLPAGMPLELGLQIGPDKKIYGFTSACIYRFDPVSLEIKVLVGDQGPLTTPGPILAGEIYFATGNRLRAAKLAGPAQK